MPFEFYNPNPKNQRVGDCAVRAISKAVGTDEERRALQKLIRKMENE